MIHYEHPDEAAMPYIIVWAMMAAVLIVFALIATHDEAKERIIENRPELTQKGAAR